jgi:hypothetical protein
MCARLKLFLKTKRHIALFSRDKNMITLAAMEYLVICSIHRQNMAL